MYDITEVREMKQASLQTIVQDVVTENTLTSQDIPALDLYMDQIMTLFEEHLKNQKRFDDDKLLTKTMINNYSKAGLIKPIKGKKYAKEQILQMVLVYTLKNTLSMQEIKTILQPIYEEEHAIKDIYDQFITIKQDQNLHTKKMIDDMLDKTELNIDKNVDRLLMIMYLSNLSQQLTRIVEKIIDTYYE